MKNRDAKQEDDGYVHTGRPSKDEEERPRLRTVTFLAGPNVMEAIKELMEDVDEDSGQQSIVIRQAILDQVARRRAAKGKG